MARSKHRGGGNHDANVYHDEKLVTLLDDNGNRVRRVLARNASCSLQLQLHHLNWRSSDSCRMQVRPYGPTSAQKHVHASPTVQLKHNGTEIHID